MRSNSLRRTLAAGTALGTHGFAAVGLSLALMAAPGVARAQINNYWLGGDGRWADASEWSEGVPPNSTLDARVQTGDDIAIDTPDARVGALWLESAESAPARAVVTSGGTLSAGYVMIGELPNQSGELVVDGPGARALVTGYVVLGRNGGDATVAVTNGGLIQTGVTQAFGNGGQARLVVDGAQSELRTGLLRLRGSGAAPALVQIAAGGTVNASSLMLEGDVRISLNDGVLAADDMSVTGGANEIAVTTAGTLRLDTRIGEFGGTLSLVKMGTGTLQLTGDHAYSGTTTISQGIVRALGAGRNSIGDASAVTIVAGATLALTGGGGAAGLEDDDETIGSLAGSGTVALGAQRLTVGANNANTIFSGSITGTGSLRKTGTGTLTLAAANSYSGGTTVADGTLVLQANEAIGQGPLTLTGGTLVANAAIQQVAALSGTGAIQVNNSLTVNQATDTLYAGTVSGSGALWKAGAGQLTLAEALSGGLRVNVSSGTLALSAANSYSGGTAIGNGAKVIVGSDQALGTGVISVFASGGGQIEADANVTLANAIVINRAPANANLAITGDHDLRLNGVISTGGSGTGGGLIKRGNGVLSLAATNTYSGGTVIEGGAIRLLNDRALGTGAIRMAGGTALSFSASPWQTLGALTLDGNVTLDVDQFQDAALNRTISGAGGFTKTGLGTLSLYGDNSFGGDVHVREGRLWVDNWAGVGNRAITDTALVTVDAGATIAFQKSEVFGALSGAGLVDITYAGELGLTVGGTNTDFTFAGNISGGDPVSPNFPRYGLTKIGSGTFTLTGASDSRAGVYVGAGMLGVEGSIASSLVDVGVGGRLGGGGSVAGTVQLYRDGTLVGAAGRTLSMGGLIMNRGAILDVTLGAPGNDALFDVAGDVRLDGTVNVADGGGFGAAGVYRLISYTGTRSGNGLTIGSLPGGVDRASLSVQTGLAGQVNLVSNAGLTLRFWDGGNAALYDNSGINGGSGLWTVGGRSWTDTNGVANGPMRPVPAFAVFQGAAGTVTLDAGHLPAVTGMQFAVDGYRLTLGQVALDGGAFTSVRVGDGTLAGREMMARIESALVGNSGLQVSDFGTLILSGNNGYTGGTRVDAATLIGSVRSIRGNLENGGTVVFEEEGSATFAGDISGLASSFGQMVKRGDGELILGGSNNLDWSVEAGGLTAHAAAFTGNVAIGGDGQLTLSSGATPGGEAVYRFALSGSGAFDVSGGGTLVLEGASRGFSGTTTIAGSTLRVDGSLGGTLQVGADGVLGGSGSVGDVRVDAGGHLVGTAGSTLRLASLDLSSGAMIDARFGRSSDPALYDVAGDLTLDGTLNIGGGTPLQAGIYRLISYGGALSDHGLDLSRVPPGQAATEFFVQTAVAGQVNLISSAGVDLRFWDGGDPARHFNGTVDGGAGIWRLGDRTWAGADGSINGSPTPPGFAVFQGTGGRVTLDDSAGALSVTGMQFAADGYSLSGSALALAGSDGHTVIRVGDGTAAGAAITTRIYAPFTGATALVKSDTGTLILSGANIYSGGTVIEGGVLSIASDDALGAADGGITFSGGSLATTAGLSTDRAVVLDRTGTISTADGTALTLNGALSGAGGLVKRGAGELILSAANSYAGDTVVEAGTLSGNVEAIRGNLSLAGTVQFAQQNDADFAGNIAALGSNPGRAVKAGIGTLSLAGTSNVRWSVDEGGLVTAASRFTGDATVASGASLRLEDAGDASYAGVLSGNGSIVKAGAERLTFTGDSAAFAGATSLEAGRLIVDGSLGGSLAVASGATLEGKGRVGDVRVTDGGRLAGGAGATLTLSSLELDSAAQVGVALGTPGQAALFDITGDLTLDGTLNLTDAGGFGAGIYRLFDYGGKLIDRGLAIGTVLSGMSPDDLAVQTSVVGQVNLVSSFGAELLFWDGGDPGRHDNGAVDGGAGIWRADGRTWTDSIGAVNGAMRPQPGFAVLQGSGGDVTLDGSAGALSVTGIQFAGNGYRLSGDGLMLAGENDRTIIRVGDGSAAGAAISATIAAPLTGTGDLIKTDLGTLTLSGANSYAGNTLIEAGTLIGDAAAIRGNVAAAGTVVFDQASDATFAGTISGLGGASGSAVKRGAGVLTLGGTSSLDWTIEAGSLVTRARSFIGDAIIGSGASLMFSQAEDGTYAGRLSGQGSLIIAGSMVRLTGDSSGFAGRVRVENGVLNTAGKLGGALTLGTGGWLRGNGSLGSVTVTSGGTIAPGDSIGTLSVNGDITFGPGSIYEVEVDPTGIASDLITATGSAILNGGAVVHIGLNGNYRPQASYTILTAAGGVQGTFADVSSSFAFLDPTLGYGANAVTLTLERNDVDFSDIAVTLNQNEVANGLGELSFGNALFDTVLLLDENGARLAFDLLSGEIYPSLLSGFVQDSRFVRGAAVDRMRHFGAAADAEPGLRFWMQGLGSRGHLDGDGNAHRLKQDSAGFLMGVDAIADETVQLGAFGGYQQGDANVRAVSSEADIDTYHVGVYAGADLGALGLRAGYAFSWHDADVTRQVAFGSFSDVATGRFDASTAQAFAEIGYRIDFGTARMEPFAQIAQIWVHSERLKELGGAAALQVARGKMSTGVSTLGARFDQSFTLGLLEANLKLSAGWRHAFNDRLAVMASRFEALSPLAIAGTPIARDAFAADIGLSLALSSRARIDLSYSGDVARKSESHAGRATLSWAF